MNKTYAWVTLAEAVEQYQRAADRSRKWFHSKSADDWETEDAEFEIVEPKQLPDSSNDWSIN